MALFRSFCYVLMLQVALTIVMVHAQDDQSGFISIDCGIAEGSTYTDKKTGINYVSDAGFTDSGINQEILSSYKSDTLDFQLNTLRSFPQNTRNCYTLRPKQGKGNRYLIRARFAYGNYDLKSQPPQFDLYLGNDYWSRIDFTRSLVLDLNRSLGNDYEIIHLTSSDYIHVCLVNIGLGNPFISALELRLLDSTMYAQELRSMMLFTRVNFGTSETIRYADDKYDRIWYPVALNALSGTRDIQTSSPVSLGSSKVPSKVMATAIIPTDPTYNLTFTWKAASKTERLIMYIYFAEIERLNRNETRKFNIYRDGFYLVGPISPFDHTTTTYLALFLNSSSYQITLNRTQNSTLPPMINAIELYNATSLQQRQTEDQDATAMWSTKSTYGLTERNWQGDPCIWDGVNCSNNDADNLRIISMNLSFSGLSGEIAPALANLTMIQSLDLSYNNLRGSVPKSLASLEFLKILNLTGNNFTRPLPAELLEKANNGQLSLSIEADSDEDTDACPKGSCERNKNKKVVIVVTPTLAALFMLVIILTFLWITKRRRTQDLSISDELIEPRNQRFTYSEVKRITNNFSNVIGKGGFGTVFKGLIGDTRAAIKMLSESSAQGYKEFQAEVHLLMGVHHKNITSLVGYCDEGSHKGIIYEYMANGNLGMHLFEVGSQNVLSWRKRLQIGYDAAQGLEYMHHGCKPPIVHRDVKCSNILLNEKLQAKLADFGLSRAFPSEGATHVSTVIAGTPCYLDPEYYTTNRLTEKSDVYSFGVVLLELITGRPAISTDIHIINWVKSTFDKGSVESIVDPRLQGNFEVITAWTVVELAMRCVDNSSVERPTMNDVVIDLNNCLNGTKTNNPNQNMSLSLESMRGGPDLR